MRNLFTIFIALCTFHSMNGQSFINGSFETWGSSTICNVNSTPNDWLDYSVACAEVDEANFTLCPTTIPPSASAGNIYARACAGPDWQGGEGVYQNISGFSIGQLYTISFDYAGSNLYGGSDSVCWKVYIDDSLINQTPYFSSSKNTWTTFSHSFIPTLSVHKIGVRAYFINPSVTGDGSAGLDNFILTKHGEETGLENNPERGTVQIYPIVMENYVTLKNKEGEECDVMVYDINSSLRITQRFKGETSLNVEGLTPGVYFFIVKSKNNLISRQTLLKK